MTLDQFNLHWVERGTHFFSIEVTMNPLLWTLIGVSMAIGGNAPASLDPGYKLLIEKVYLPTDFDQEIYDNLWTVWEEPLRTTAASASLRERREMALRRYGLTTGPSRSDLMPVQYTPDGAGGWAMNCLACHGGKLMGEFIPGLPNTHFALQTFTDDIRQVKVKLKRKLTHMDVGSTFIPLGASNGTTNAVIFGIALGAFRDEDLNIRPNAKLPKMIHHDHDAPPWWNVRHKTYLYADGFAPKDHRALMQFLLVQQNGPEKFREWENDYKKILEWIEAMRPPAYPWPLDSTLASQGRLVFDRHCSECHGTYGDDGRYPNKNVRLDRVGTDPVRLGALPVVMREGYSRNWLSYYGEKKVITDPKGYVAPPLDGIWASAPYFHNGSVPTLWHVLHPGDRPVVWRRSEDGYDRAKVGLEVTEFQKIPDEVKRPSDKRTFFDTRLFGKSAGGHLFPNRLDEAEKRAVLEYLKTL